MIHLTSYDHVGIRVSNRQAAIGFYKKLGFLIDPKFTDDRVAELLTPTGVRINLIFNGAAQAGAHNILLDHPVKLPGYTHAAFVVHDLEAVVRWADAEGIVITEGPVDWGRRLTCFIRDPDGNVLEFNQLKD